MQRSAQERVFNARVALVLDSPFFGVLATQLVLVEDPSCETMWTDSVSIGFNPVWVGEQSDAEIKGTLVHEVLHVTGGHCWRGGSRNPEDWNEACDYAINPIAAEAGFILPQGVLRNVKYDGKPAELIYEFVKKEHPDGKPESKQSKDSKDSGKDKQPDDNGQGKNDDGKPDAGKGGKAKGKPGKKGAKGDAQDKSDGPASGGDPANQQPKPAGEVRPCPAGVDPKKLETEWKVMVSNAANFAASQGDIPGYLKDFIDKVKEPVVDWRESLWQFVQQSIYSPDYKWSKPNRNYLPTGLYLPALVGEQMPPLVVAEDTSFSVFPALTKLFRSELGGIIDQMKPEVTYHIQADTRITKITELQPGDEINLEVAGRGGTDFRPVFSWIDKESINPACAIYQSDMDGPFPEVEPDYPVLWVCPPGCKNPPWGLKLEIPFEYTSAR